MRKLGAGTAAHWPENLPDDPEVVTSPEEREGALHNARELAASLGQAARQIPAITSRHNMSQADRHSFQSAAAFLEDQANRLGRAARRGNIEEMQGLLDSIRASCISCHTRFKDVSGEIPPRA